MSVDLAWPGNSHTGNHAVPSQNGMLVPSALSSTPVSKRNSRATTPDSTSPRVPSSPKPIAIRWMNSRSSVEKRPSSVCGSPGSASGTPRTPRYAHVSPRTSSRPSSAASSRRSSMSTSGEAAGEGDRVATQYGDYVLEMSVGEGTYGKVYVGYHQKSGKEVAIKVLEKDKLHTVKQKTRVKREIRALKLLHHPYIVDVYDVLETNSKIVIVTEYASGGELFDYIVSKRKVQEHEARKFFRQIVAAIDYCHQNSIVHRDLKPENLLLNKENDIRIIDFGFSNTFKQNDILDTFCGSPYYAAPEMVSGRHYCGPEVDVWSMGVILYALVCGCLPFDHQDVRTLYAMINQGKYSLPRYISEECKEFIALMLVVSPEERATIEQLRHHPWLNDGYKTPPRAEVPQREPLVDDLNPLVVKELCSYGYDQRDVQKITSDDPTVQEIRCMYHLIVERKARLHTNKIRAEQRKRAQSASTLIGMHEIPAGAMYSGYQAGGRGVVRNSPLIAPPQTPPRQSAARKNSEGTYFREREKPAGAARPSLDNVVVPIALESAHSGGSMPTAVDALAHSPSPSKRNSISSRFSLDGAMSKLGLRSRSSSKAEPAKKKPRKLSGFFRGGTNNTTMDADSMLSIIVKSLEEKKVEHTIDGYTITVTVAGASGRKPVKFKIEICYITRIGLNCINTKRLTSDVFAYQAAVSWILNCLDFNPPAS